MDLADEQGVASDEAWWQRKAYGQMRTMKERGILLPTDEPYLEQLRAKVGE